MIVPLTAGDFQWLLARAGETVVRGEEPSPSPSTDHRKRYDKIIKRYA